MNSFLTINKHGDIVDIGHLEEVTPTSTYVDLDYLLDEEVKQSKKTSKPKKTVKAVTPKAIKEKVVESKVNCIDIIKNVMDTEIERESLFLEEAGELVSVDLPTEEEVKAAEKILTTEALPLYKKELKLNTPRKGVKMTKANALAICTVHLNYLKGIQEMNRMAIAMNEMALDESVYGSLTMFEKAVDKKRTAELLKLAKAVIDTQGE